MKKLWICIGIAFYGTLPLHAANMVSASAHANGISVTLQDLDLEDGVSPALMWGFDDFGSIERSASVYDGSGFPGSGSSSFADDLSIGIAGASASNAANLGEMHAFVEFAQGAQDRHLNAYSDLFLDPSRRSNSPTEYWGYDHNFTLTANTAVTFSTVATVAAQAYSGVGPPWAYASVTMGAGLLTFSDGSYPYVFVSQDGVTSNVMSVYNGTSELSVSFHNTTAVEKQAYFYSELYAGAFAPAALTPVPEPQLAAMMFAGLCAVGAMVRRKKVRL